MSRNIALPEVSVNGLQPYVVASKFPNGAIAIATEGRVKPDQSWIHPKAAITLKGMEINKPIGIFGYYESLTLSFTQNLPGKMKIYAQDLLSERAIDISKRVAVDGNTIKFPGDLIQKIGTSASDKGDNSAPGMVVKIIAY